MNIFLSKLMPAYARPKRNTASKIGILARNSIMRRIPVFAKMRAAIFTSEKQLFAKSAEEKTHSSLAGLFAAAEVVFPKRMERMISCVPVL
jgi:hypothetical protein